MKRIKKTEHLEKSLEQSTTKPQAEQDCGLKKIPVEPRNKDTVSVGSGRAKPQTVGELADSWCLTSTYHN